MRPRGAAAEQETPCAAEAIARTLEMKQSGRVVRCAVGMKWMGETTILWRGIRRGPR